MAGFYTGLNLTIHLRAASRCLITQAAKLSVKTAAVKIFQPLISLFPQKYFGSSEMSKPNFKSVFGVRTVRTYAVMVNMDIQMDFESRRFPAPILRTSSNKREA